MSNDNDGETEFERGYIKGVRRARINNLRNAIREIIGYDPGIDLEARVADWIIKRQEAIARLRDLCAEHGDNDWPDDLHLADVIEKHIYPAFEPEGGES